MNVLLDFYEFMAHSIVEIQYEIIIKSLKHLCINESGRFWMTTLAEMTALKDSLKQCFTDGVVALRLWMISRQSPAQNISLSQYVSKQLNELKINMIGFFQYKLSVDFVTIIHDWKCIPELKSRDIHVPVPWLFMNGYLWEWTKILLNELRNNCQIDKIKIISGAVGLLQKSGSDKYKKRNKQFYDKYSRKETQETTLRFRNVDS
eukprot:386818_1